MPFKVFSTVEVMSWILLSTNTFKFISENLLTSSIEFFEKKIGPTLIPVTKDLTSFAIAMACLRSGVSRATKIGAFLTTIFQFLTDINFRSIFLAGVYLRENG